MRAYAGRAYLPPVIPAGVAGGFALNRSPCCSPIAIPCLTRHHGDGRPSQRLSRRQRLDATSATPPTPVVNTMTVTVDTGPAAATGAINHAYVTVKVCAPGSQTQCASIDHVLLDTGSWGLRLVRSVLTADTVTLSAETDAQGNTIEECVTFGGGQTWGPVALGRHHAGGRSRGQIAGAGHG